MRAGIIVLASMEQLVLRSLALTCVSIVLSSWLAAFATGRVATCHTFYTEHASVYREASFLLSEVCFNDTIKANLGSNGYMCEQAARSLAITPILRALYSTAEVTYLCGQSSCTELYHSITASWSSFFVTVALTLAVSPVLYRKLIRWGVRSVRRRRRKGDNHLVPYTEDEWSDGWELPLTAHHVGAPRAHVWGAVTKQKVI